MSDATDLFPRFYIKLDGQENKEFFTAVANMQLESSLHLPDALTITLNDPEFKWADGSVVEPGKALIVSAKVERQEETIFDGEIVEVEQQIDQEQKSLIIRAFDRLHRLARGRHARTFLNVTDGDIVKKLAQESGLQAKTGPTPTVHKYVIQANQTNLEFLRDRAAALGFLMFAEAKELHFEAPSSNGTPIELEYGVDLSEFRPRLSTVGQAGSVTARGWDPEKKQEVVGQAQSSQIRPQNGVSKSGGATAQSAYSIDAKMLVTDRPLRVQATADKLAQSVIDRLESGFVEAEGVCSGNPKIVAGASIKIKGVGKKFSGTYFVTSATHTFGPGEWETRFAVSGTQPSTLLSMLAPDELDGSLPAGLVIGVVTDNKDPDNLGRVKFKLPWLDSQIESDWARVVSVGGGAQRGIQFLPEVNDEVLVGFEMGDINVPYVIGGLWNGKDQPPLTSDQAVKGGQTIQRTIRSRAGHEITISDTPGDKEEILIKTSKGLLVRLSDKDKVIELKSDKSTVKLDDQGNAVAIDTQGDLKISSKGKVSIEAATGMDLKSNASVSIQGNSQVDVKSNGMLGLSGNGPAELKSSAIVTIQGSLVKIN